MKTVLITSFRRSKTLDFATYSVAVYQPKGFNYPELTMLKILDGGRWIMPHNFIRFDEPLHAYHQALRNLYHEREQHIRAWLAEDSLAVAICCWCPYEKAAQRQLKEWGTFVCHTSVVGEILQEYGAQVFYDADRRLMKVLP